MTPTYCYCKECGCNVELYCVCARDCQLHKQPPAKTGGAHPPQTENEFLRELAIERATDSP